MPSRWLLTPLVSVFNAMAHCTCGASNRGPSPPARSDGTVTGDDWDTVSQDSEDYEISRFSHDCLKSDVEERLQCAISMYSLSELPQRGASSDEEAAGAPKWSRNESHSASPAPAFRLDATLGRRSRVRRRSRGNGQAEAVGANSSRRSATRWQQANAKRVQPYKKDFHSGPSRRASHRLLNPLEDAANASAATTTSPSNEDPRDVWRANAELPLRPTKPNDWSALQRQLLDWNVPLFSGGAATWRPLLAARLGARAVFRWDTAAAGMGFPLYEDARAESSKTTPDTSQRSEGALDTSSYLSSNSDEVLSLRRDRSLRGTEQCAWRSQRRERGARGGSDLTAVYSDSDAGDEDAILRTYTPRQRRLHASLYPPKRCLDVRPTEAAWTSTLKRQLFQGLTPQEEQKALIKLFKTFVVELTRGAYFTQLAGKHQYFTLHCQLTETLDSLTIDPNSGERIEFPLQDVVRVFRLNRPLQSQSASFYDNAPLFCSLESASNKKGTKNASRIPHLIPPLNLTALVAQPDLLVVVQFKTRKRLAFVFKDPVEADQFCLCLELLIEHVREKNSGALSWFDLTKRQDRRRGQQSKTALHDARSATPRSGYRRNWPSSCCGRCCYSHPGRLSRRRCCCYWTENFLPVGSVVKNGWMPTPASSSCEGLFSDDSHSDSSLSKGSDGSYSSRSPPETPDRKSTKGGMLSPKPSIVSLSSSNTSLHSGGTTVPPSTPRSKNMGVAASMGSSDVVLPSKKKSDASFNTASTPRTQVVQPF